MTTSVTISTHIPPDQEQTFRHLPFSVPAGVTLLSFDIHYNDRIGSGPLLRGGNTLDIGVFDEQGIESGSPGLRGWSGSERVAFQIGERWATPPYRAGAIGAGIWHLCLGAYKIGPTGLDVTATIRFDEPIEEPAIPLAPELASLQQDDVPPAAEPGWFRGDLHQHTVYSDGDSYPHEVAAIAYCRGLDFYGITDHNRAQSPVGLVPEGDGWPVLVPGVEVTTYGGHFNVWGTESWYDFRSPTAAGLQAAVDHALADGGFVSLNHPRPYGPEWRFPEVTGFHAIEAWNGWFPAFNDVSVRYWSDRLVRDAAGAWPIGICGSDCHRNAQPGALGNPLSSATMGYPCLWIQTDAPLSAKAVLGAMKAGRCFISEGPAGPQLYLRQTNDAIEARVVGAAGDALLMVGPAGCVGAAAITSDDQTIRWAGAEALADDRPWARFEVHAASGHVRALSQPVWR